MIAIDVENLCKRYQLRHQQAARYATLRDRLADRLNVVVRRLAHPLSMSVDPSAGPDQEDFYALKEVTFQVRQGERLGIIGRNGAGKSTLLKILSRITEPSAGRVRIKGRVASLLEVGTGFHPELTGRENIFLNGAILGMGRAEIRRRFDEIVAFAEVEKFLDTPVKRYSSGMYVRLAFAVAAHLESEILIVDEVLAVGDVSFQQKCLGKMERIGGDGRTVIFVSHNLGAIRQLCTSALLLSDGQLCSHGSVESVIISYVKKFERVESGGPVATNPEKQIVLNSLVLRDLDGRELRAAEVGQPLVLDFSLSCQCALENCLVAVTVDTSDGIRICALHNEIVGDVLTIAPPGGTLRCVLPRVCFVPGSYRLTFKLKMAGEIIFYLPLAFSMMVESGDFFGTGRLPEHNWGGLFYVKHSWQVLPAAESVKKINYELL